MAKLHLEIKERVAVITMNEGENRLNLDMCSDLLSMLDKVEKETDASTLVVTSAHEKIWCYGFDIDWVNEHLAKGNTDKVTQFLAVGLELRKRLLSYPLITIASINGHAIGGAAVLSLCFDFRFMRLERGFFCVPAIDRGYTLLPGTGALFFNKLPLHVVYDVILTGRKVTSGECAANNIVAAAYHNDVLMGKVMEFAAGLNKERTIVKHMKEVLNGGIIRLMNEDVQYIQGGNLRV